MLQYDKIQATELIWQSTYLENATIYNSFFPYKNYQDAYKDGSFWRVKASDGFYPVGDKICKGHNSCGQLFRLKDVASLDILAQANFQYYLGSFSN